MNRIELGDSVDQLVDLMRTDKGSVDSITASEGEALLAIFTDEIMAKKNKAFPDCREIALRDAIDDLANGGQVLAKGSIGVKYEEGAMVPYVQLSSEAKQLNAAFSIRLKKTAAFNQWRSDDEIIIPQEQLNSCIYFLITEIARAGA